MAPLAGEAWGEPPGGGAAGDDAADVSGGELVEAGTAGGDDFWKNSSVLLNFCSD